MATEQRAARPTMTEAERSPRRSLNFRLLEIFVAVVHANGMTGAAAALNLTQSAVSQAVGNLEASVNAKLIDRGTRPLKLTLLGDIIYKRTVEILDKVRDLDRAVDLQLNNSLPVLRLGIANSVASTVGPHLVRKLDTLAAQWIIWSGFAETSIRSLVERRVDFIITSEEPPAQTGFISIPIFEEPYLLVVPAALAETHRSIEALAAVAPFIRYGSQTFIGQAIDAYFQRSGLVPPNRYRLDTSDAVLAMVEEATGWTISSPLLVLKARITSPRFRCLPLPRTAPVRRVFLIALASEDNAIAHQIAEATRSALIENCLPKLQEISPGATFRTDFADPLRRKAARSPSTVRASAHRGLTKPGRSR